MTEETTVAEESEVVEAETIGYIFNYVKEKTIMP